VNDAPHLLTVERRGDEHELLDVDAPTGARSRLGASSPTGRSERAASPAAGASSRSRHRAPQSGATPAGVVRDDRSDALLPGAWVTLHADTARETRPLRGALTDAQGRYRLDELPAGHLVLRVRRAEYMTEAIGVQVGDCGVVVSPGAGVPGCEARRNVYLVPLTRC
jgi:hypothetical protein